MGEPMMEKKEFFLRRSEITISIIDNAKFLGPIDSRDVLEAEGFRTKSACGEMGEGRRGCIHCELR
jgi:hypothetical protein